MPPTIQTFRDLIVWRKAFELCVIVYRTSELLPPHERYGLSVELRKTVRSIAYNIAEGHRRSSTREYVRFLDIARGSAAELETQLLLAETLGYFDEETTTSRLLCLKDIDCMLAALMSRLRERIRSRVRQGLKEP